MKVEKIIVGPLEVCCYLVFCDNTKEGIIIDPGDVDKRIFETIEKLNLKIKAIIGTHGHPDHIGGVDFLRRKLDAPFLLHKMDDQFFQIEENFLTFKLWGFPKNPRADVLIEEGSVISFGDETLKVLHTPGHSPGSICLYCERNKVVFTGDTLFVEGIGRADLPGGNYFQMVQSIKEKLLTLPEETIIYPGHDYGPKPFSTIGYEKLNNPFINEFL